MKRYAPYIFPVIVAGVVGLVGYRWYDSQRVETTDLFSEGVRIENLSVAEREAALTTGAGDYTNVELRPATGLTTLETAPAPTGVVRYEIEEGLVKFGVIAGLPESEGPYQVWLREIGGEATRLAFSLEMGKGGYVGSASISADLLPFEVLVTRETQTTPSATDVLFTSVIEEAIEEME